MEQLRIPPSARGIVRREVLVGALLALAAGSAPRGSSAAPVPLASRLFLRGPLAANPLAARFEVVDHGVHVPPIEMLSETGRKRLGDVRSPATLVSLWADWCSPCLAEMHDLADLGRRHSERLGVVALLQGSELSLAGARAKLDGVGARGITSWIEPNGASVAAALGTPAGARGFTLPCNLLFDRFGRLRGRAFGSDILSQVELDAHGVTSAGKRELLHARTAWSTPAADSFAQALSEGCLDHVA